MSGVSTARIDALNAGPVRPARDYVLFWMTAQRRCDWSYSLQRAAEEAARLARPLLVFEALRLDYPHACARFHDFVLDGMRDNQRACEAAGVRYYGYVEPRRGAGAGLLEALAARACLVVTDRWPCFFLPRMIEAAAARLDVRLEAVDGVGVSPLAASGRVFTTAASYRRHVQKTILEHLPERPAAQPLGLAPALRAALPEAALERWPATELSAARASALPVDQGVSGGAVAGGARAAAALLEGFFEQRLERFDRDRNRVESGAASGLSPYLHFGHISPQRVVARLLDGAGWMAPPTPPKATGSRQGWWGLDPAREAFLDQIITWRELGFVFCHQRPDCYDRFESLPDWARASLALHAADPRPIVYSREQLDGARTHDEVWNAAQRQLVRDGAMHNYLRMLWGKKILEWSPSPQEALETALWLNNRYALDGRDPSSYSGVFWIFGRFDRAWGPERPIFGKVRYMSSDSARRKLDLRGYLRSYRA